MGIIQLVQTYIIYALDDSANHSTPTIRNYVKQVIEKRGSELQVIPNDKEVEENDKEVKENEKNEKNDIVVLVNEEKKE